jgi:hypothetical protein
VEEYIYRPVFSRVLAGVTAVICAVALVIVLIHDGIGYALELLPWLALVSGAAWAVFWNPCVRVDDSGVRFVNVTRTIDLPWPSIQRIDTKWALALVTSFGTFTAWCAPAPSRMSARRLSRHERTELPESTYVGKDTIRPGDAPGSPSGDVALVVRRQWDALRDAGHLDNPVLESDRPRVTWHLPLLAGAVVLVALGVLAGTI